jgi:predicted nucleic acid-binding protein
MCLIVDANLAGLIFGSPPHPDFVPVLDWLQQREGRLVVGGHLAAELGRLEKARRFVIQLQRAGIVRQVPAEEVAREETVVAETGLCESNDSHVVALARLSGARTLCTHDKALQRDFRNPQLVAKPRGSVYQRPDHTGLLRHTPTSCGLGRKRR